MSNMEKLLTLCLLYYIIKDGIRTYKDWKNKKDLQK